LARFGESEEKMATNPDFRDLLSALSAERAEYLIVGAHAVMLYTAPRYTKDLDIWVRPTPENAQRVYHALAAFGAPMADLTVEDLATPGTIFQIGIEPNRIDVITSVEKLDFDRAWSNRVASTYGGIPISVLSIDDLLENKRAVGRPQDVIDIERLEKVRKR
jgi:hypothetical protein